MKSALIVIDVQQSFEHRPYYSADELPPFIGRLQKLIDRAQSAGIPVLQVFHEEPEGVFSRASGYVKTMSALRIEPTETFNKSVHSALYARAASGKLLETWLLDHGIEHVIVTGIRTEQCCETTARHASDAGFRVTYALDATLTFSMVSKSGRKWSPQEIVERTALVLDGRFAKVVQAEAVAL